jgi:hypothetical protein
MLKRKTVWIKRQWKIAKTLTMSYFKKNNITKFQQLDPVTVPVVLMAGLSCTVNREINYG